MSGVGVENVVPGSPASEAGFIHGDIVAAINGTSIASSKDVAPIWFVLVRLASLLLANLVSFVQAIYSGDGWHVVFRSPTRRRWHRCKPASA